MILLTNYFVKVHVTLDENASFYGLNRRATNYKTLERSYIIQKDDS